MAQLAWHTSVSILVAGGMVAAAVYLALRPSSPEPNTAAPTELAARPADRSAAISPMVERDRRRRLDELDQADEHDVPATADRSREDPSDAELAMAVASPMLGMPPVPQALTERVRQDASEAFEDIRTTVRSDCWDALPDDPEAPDTVDVTLSLSYDAGGKLLASGVSEDRGNYRAGLAECLGPLVHGLEVPPPGSNLSIELRVAIP